ncbi:unnamed protein product, partial [Ectocarpus sp. 4 AP-2014]
RHVPQVWLCFSYILIYICFFSDRVQFWVSCPVFYFPSDEFVFLVFLFVRSLFISIDLVLCVPCVFRLVWFGLVTSTAIPPSSKRNGKPTFSAVVVRVANDGLATAAAAPDLALVGRALARPRPTGPPDHPILRLRFAFVSPSTQHHARAETQKKLHYCRTDSVLRTHSRRTYRRKASVSIVQYSGPPAPASLTHI